MGKGTWRPGWIVLGTVVLVCSCKSGPALTDVQGTVTKGGSPQKQVMVQFTPVSGGRSADARTDTDGHYKLIYAPGMPGALVGKHRVVISTGGERDENGSLISNEKVVFRGEFEVQPGPNVIDISIP